MISDKNPTELLQHEHFTVSFQLSHKQLPEISTYLKGRFLRYLIPGFNNNSLNCGLLQRGMVKCHERSSCEKEISRKNLNVFSVRVSTKARDACLCLKCLLLPEDGFCSVSELHIFSELHIELLLIPGEN